jgi:hypothetical protein
MRKRLPVTRSSGQPAQSNRVSLEFFNRIGHKPTFALKGY